MELTDSDEGEKKGGYVSETPRDCTSKKTKCLGVYTCDGKADWCVLVKNMGETMGEYEPIIWRSNLELMRERWFARRAT